MIVGVDPGAAGAIAAVSRAGELLFAEDMPAIKIKRGKTDKNEIAGYELAELFRERVEAGAIVFVELVGGMQGQSASAAFNFGRAAGAPEYIAQAFRHRVERVAPATWKRSMGVLGGGKDASRAMASRLWPTHSALFRRVKDNDRAEAALIAEWGRRKLLREAGEKLRENADVFA